MTDQIDAAAKFSNRHDGQVKRAASAAACVKNARTPRLVRLPFLISLMMFVSIKYTPGLAGILNTLKIRVVANIGHAHQHLRECLSLRPAKRIGQDGPMFGLGTPAICRSLLAQALNDTVIHVTHQ